ncbi:hypothetical protein O6H91_16G028900 [Diphasiastrum complanatum]|uniref:Uncharacterized protein n=1 Tax=Diphasiastrum complanatum TaxID=34168 RepID=A0ACC2BC15_DIPCM|nr:hypothetical protein O6H91_16G028900 [Diphasiastrum complanatum]
MFQLFQWNNFFIRMHFPKTRVFSSKMATFQSVPTQVESSFIRHNVVQDQMAQSSPVHRQISLRPATPQLDFMNDNDEGSSATHSAQRIFQLQDADAQMLPGLVLVMRNFVSCWI